MTYIEKMIIVNCYMLRYADWIGRHPTNDQMPTIKNTIGWMAKKVAEVDIALSEVKLERDFERKHRGKK